jgi:hypothetical protein
MTPNKGQIMKLIKLVFKTILVTIVAMCTVAAVLIGLAQLQTDTTVTSCDVTAGTCDTDNV